MRLASYQREGAGQRTDQNLGNAAHGSREEILDGLVGASGRRLEFENRSLHCIFYIALVIRVEIKKQLEDCWLGW